MRPGIGHSGVQVVFNVLRGDWEFRTCDSGAKTGRQGQHREGKVGRQAAPSSPGELCVRWQQTLLLPSSWAATAPRSWGPFAPQGGLSPGSGPLPSVRAGGGGVKQAPRERESMILRELHHSSPASDSLRAPVTGRPQKDDGQNPTTLLTPPLPRGREPHDDEEAGGGGGLAHHAGVSSQHPRVRPSPTR